MGCEQSLEERGFTSARRAGDDNGSFGNCGEVSTCKYSLLVPLEPSGRVPGAIFFATGIWNWDRGDVEYCADLCTSLKSLGVLAAGRLKNSIS